MSSSNHRPATRDRLLETLQRDGPQTVSELAKRFSLSPMAVRLHMCRLERDEMAVPTRKQASRGRPAKVYALTPKAHSQFPQRSGDLALEVLIQVEQEAGREVVIRALERRARDVVENYRERLNGLTAGERIAALAAIRDGEGYLCDASSNGAPLPDLVERHCPVSEIAERWPEVCRIEADVLADALGATVERSEHLLNGDNCCRYTVGRPV